MWVLVIVSYVRRLLLARVMKVFSQNPVSFWRCEGERIDYDYDILVQPCLSVGAGCM